MTIKNRLKELICIIFGHKWVGNQTRKIKINTGFSPSKIFIDGHTMNLLNGVYATFNKCERCSLSFGVPVVNMRCRTTEEQQ